MEAEVYYQVKTSIKKLLNIDLSYYKDEQMKRRLDSWLARTQAHSWQDYFRLVADNPVECDRFRNYLTINVTEFFRDPDRWKSLQADVLPDLLRSASSASSSNGSLRVWSAGCSIGVEAYTLAMICEQMPSVRSYQILATDLDRGALEKARARGPYLAEEIRNLSPAQREKFLTPAAPYFIRDTLGKNIVFREQNLLADTFDRDFDLIVCRNVVIYFTTEAKDLLYRKFAGALRPGGVLFLGGTEIISRPAEFGFRNFGISFYKKV